VGIGTAPSATSVWYDPHLRNPLFTGRLRLLRKIEHSLAATHPPGTKALALCGLGGVGKTQVANEYAYQSLGRFAIIWWVGAESVGRLVEDLAALALQLGVDHTVAEDPTGLAQAAVAELARRSEWLLIFDNAESLNVVRPFLPTGGSGQILITSRNPDWAEVATVLTVQTWEREESAAFLRLRTGRDADDQALALAEELGDLPLALSQAAAFMVVTGTTYAEYIELFHTRRTELWEHEGQLLASGETVTTTWLISIRRVSKESPESAKLLGFLATLGSGSFERWHTQAHLLNPTLSGILSDSLRLKAAVGILHRFSLVEVNGDVFAIHPLVRSVILDHQSRRRIRKHLRIGIAIAAATVCVTLLFLALKRSWDATANQPRPPNHLPRLEEALGPVNRGMVLSEGLMDVDGHSIKYVNQNWSPQDRRLFYFTPIGSRIMPYPWFLALERGDDRTLFREVSNLDAYRFLNHPKNVELNPDGLPIGLTRGVGESREWLGLTCAACHTAQIKHGGLVFRIDGAPAQLDLQGFFTSLIEALKANRDRQDKFERFATRILGTGIGEGRRETLKAQMTSILGRMEAYKARNFPLDHPHGFGRVDAFGSILNEMYLRANERGDRASDTASQTCNAPVSYPFLWDTPQHEVVQWNGSIGNTAEGALVRNVCESLGVFVEFEIADKDSVLGYRSSVRLSGLQVMTPLLTRLWSPVWPDEFSKLDIEKVERGLSLYRQHCMQCHSLIDSKNPQRKVAEVLVPAGTDPLAFVNFWSRKGRSGKLEGGTSMFFPSAGRRIEAEIDGPSLLTHTAIGVIVGSGAQVPRDDLANLESNVGTAKVRERSIRIPVDPRYGPRGPAYKARPLNGIWSTAPYLHNGSVPTLYDLLLPHKFRPVSFTVGSREFDTVKVGFVSDDKDSFIFHTRENDGKPIAGNSNAGHEYGVDLPDDDRWALIEYLKTL
jgi:NB-ARC domain